MSFLHGVLESVKDDDNVTTYDKYIDNKDHQLQKLLDSLQSSIGQGRSVFGERIEKVNDKTGDVKNKLGELLHDTIEKYATNVVSGHQDKKLETQLQAWTSVLGSISDAVNDIETKHVNFLDNSLSTQITHEIKLIKATVQTLKLSAGNDTIKQQVIHVDETLVEEKEKVDSSIRRECKDLWVKLDVDIRKVLEEIMKLYASQKTHFTNIRGTLKDCRRFLDTFDNDYKIPILQKFVDLKDAMTEIRKTDADKCLLEEQVEKIKSAVEDVGRELGGCIRNLNGCMDEAYRRIEQAQKYASQFMKKEVGKENQDVIEEKVAELKVWKDRLDDYIKNDFIQEMDTLVKGVQDKVTELDEEFIRDMTRVTGRINSGIVNYITKLVEAVVAGEGQYLGNIANKLPKGSKLADWLRGYIPTGLGNNGNPTNEEIAKVLKALTNFADVGEHNMSAYSAISKDLHGKIKNEIFYGKEMKAAFNKLTPALNSISHYSKKVFDISPTVKKLTELSTDISTNLSTLTKTVSKTGRYVNVYLYDLKSKNIDDQLGKIRDQLGKLHTAEFSDDPGAIQQAITATIVTVNRLESLPGQVENAQDAAVKITDTFNTVLKEQIHTISYYVELADSALTQAIDAVRESLQTAHINAEQSVSHLSDTVIATTKQAFSALTNSIHSLFSTSHAADLQALRALVDQQLREVQTIIARDAVTGVKGMLKWMKGTGEYSLGEIQKIVPTPTQPTLTAKDHSGKFKDLSTRFEKYADKVLVYIEGQVKTPNKDPSQDPESNPQSDNVHDIQGKLDYLLNYLKRNTSGNLIRPFNFDHVSDELLEKLKKSVTNLTSPNFHGFHNPLLLDALKGGMTKFTEQLSHAYVNKYSGEIPTDSWVEDDTKSTKNPADKVLSTEGRNCAKVCLTILEIFSHDLNELKHQCETNWKNRKICLKNSGGSINDLGLCLKRFGYGVPSIGGKQDDELTSKCSGDNILTKLTQLTLTVKENYTVMTNIEKLHDCLATYYRVCHLPTITSPKYPSSIYQMLTWLSGLPHSQVYLQLTTDGFNDLFEKPEEQSSEGSKAATPEDSEGGEPSFDILNEVSLPAYPEDVTVASLSASLADVCTHAHDVLTSILGHGHSGGRYACEFNTNPDQLSYPSSMTSLVCWLFDILKRVHHQLYLLYQQCHYTTDLGGWRDCWYGREVGGSAWRCNEKQCPNQIANQTHKQRCDQNCNQSVKCGLKSPLQSFLEDGLPAYLPHQVKSERGKLECPVKQHFNFPCKTPMGFTDISHMASHTHVGKHIYVSLARLCGDEWSPLSRLCAQLSCLLPTAPQTLGDMFAFYYTFLNGWINNRREKDKLGEHRETAFKEAVKSANFGDPDTTLEITDMFKSSNHILPKSSGQTCKHLTGDLYSLVNCHGESSTPSHPCGPYLRPICQDICSMFASKNNGKYLTWIVYLTDSFHGLLKALYEECKNTCDGDRAKCRISKCNKGCKAIHSPMSPTSAHTDNCNSIVNCKFIRPTLYKYGFTHKDCKSLSDNSGKRTCKDFCMILKSAISEECSKRAALAELIYKTIPDYLCKIRSPFMNTLLALWSVSLLYLLHIAVVRLDVLRIRSHLRSPSSHRIAAQSLLAAARVKALANVKYFSP
ncbi:hypothetical protein, conserved [Babesia ovata]|uniref:C3H1-type domain-containing protein n=1 Tax=Babesia ovata TaxID=189622 RepID=A0A2H6KJT2_9APIC|nr:uncharacterized protein BOVATA_047340 [Babesia ovata]GBE63241.1 hypothetical protein, conserved [Babesia ovata]